MVESRTIIPALAFHTQTQMAWEPLFRCGTGQTLKQPLMDIVKAAV